MQLPDRHTANALPVSALILVLVTVCCSLSASARSAEWPFEITAQCRPGAYWWIPGSAFDAENIDWNLRQMSGGGIGTAHIIPIYGAKGYEQKYVKYLSPQWMSMLAHAVRTANELGMNVDMSTGTGWCFGGPDLPPYARDMRVRWDGRKKRITTSGGRSVKRPAPGGEGSMLNAFSPRAMLYYVERFSKAFDDSRAPMPRAQYHDSFEYAGDWCEEFLDEFKTRRGYDLTPHLGTFFGKTSSGNRELKTRLKYDYRLTLSDLHYDTMMVWCDWARARGMLTRNEAHGAPANILDVYALSDIPETEMFGAPSYPVPGFRRDSKLVRKGDTDLRILKFSSSAAHVAHEPGRQLVGSESFTWLREHWHGTLGQIRLAVDGFFIAGVNHMFYHGTCYSPKDAPWPGWFFYASTKADWRNAIWHDIGFLNAYIARCQSVLQAGEPANDILLYWPVHDYWSNPEGLPLRKTVHHASWISSQRVGVVADLLAKTGHHYDLFTDRMLKRFEAADGLIRAPGGSYRCIVIPECAYMPVDTMRALADLSRSGARIMFEKHLPKDVPGNSKVEARRAALLAQSRRLALPASLVASDVAAGLDSLGVRRESMYDIGLQCMRRRTPDGATWYFIVNQTAKDFDGWLRLANPCASATLHDPLTARSGALSASSRDGSSDVYLQLDAGSSVVIALDEQTAAQPRWRYLTPGPTPRALAGRWNIEFIDGGPALPDAYASESLACWTKAPDERAQAFAGTARYTTTFTLDDHRAPADWLLDLGDVRESARVRINGRDAGALFALPFRMRVGEFLRTGENTLEIEVTNLSANRIRDLDKRKADWRIMRDINIVNVWYKKFAPASWPLTPSGLLGPVKLVPLQPTVTGTPNR
jgi:hypothetical protein